MNFADPNNPTNSELRDWAAANSQEQPVQDWDLILSWSMDRGRLRTCVELAASSAFDSADFFLLLLYRWISFVAKQDNFEDMRLSYAEWLGEARGTKDSRVKNWRHQAKLILENGRQLNQEEWWNELRRELGPN